MRASSSGPPICGSPSPETSTRTMRLELRDVARGDGGGRSLVRIRLRHVSSIYARTRSAAYVQREASLSRSLRRRLTQEAVGRSSCCCGAASWTSVRSARRVRRSTGRPCARAIPRRARTPAKLPPRSSSTSTSGTPRRRMPQPLKPLGRHKAREGRSARSLTTEDSSPAPLRLLSDWPAIW